MMLCLGESLAAHGRFEPEDIIARYGAWLESQPLHVSLTVRAALISYRSGTHWDVASRRAFEILGGPTAGNGSLIRCAPVGLLYAGDASLRHELSHRESMLTHFDRLAGWSCAAFNDLITAALHGGLAAEVPAIAAHVRRRRQARQRHPARHAGGRGGGDREFVVRARHAADGAVDGAARRRLRARRDDRREPRQRRDRRGRRHRRSGRRRLRRVRHPRALARLRWPYRESARRWSPTASRTSPASA